MLKKLSLATPPNCSTYIIIVLFHNWFIKSNRFFVLVLLKIYRKYSLVKNSTISMELEMINKDSEFKIVSNCVKHVTESKSLNDLFIYLPTIVLTDICWAYKVAGVNCH